MIKDLRLRFSFLTLFCYIAAQIILSDRILLFHSLPFFGAWLTVFRIAISGVLVGTILILIHFISNGFPHKIFSCLPSPGEIFSIGILTLGIKIVAFAFLGILSLFFHFQVPIFGFQGTIVPFVIIVFLICILAPLVEEILFRGIILEWWSEDHRHSFSVTLSTAMFIIIHFNLGQAFPAAFLGFLAAWVYLRKRSVLHSFIVHAIWNALAILEPVFVSNILFKSNKTAQFAFYLYLALSILGFVIIVIGSKICRKFLHSVSHPPSR